jgi:hypothetical protein
MIMSKIDTKKINVDIELSINVEDIISSIGEMDYDDIFEIIKKIDVTMQDWDFTERLYEHFKKLHEEYIKEWEFLSEEDFK